MRRNFSKAVYIRTENSGVRGLRTELMYWRLFEIARAIRMLADAKTYSTRL